MPRLGGLAVIAGFIVSVVYLILVMTLEKNPDLDLEEYKIKLIGFLVGGIIIGIVCFIDDVRGVPAWIKLIVQILSAAIVVSSGILIDSIKTPTHFHHN